MVSQKGFSSLLILVLVLAVIAGVSFFGVVVFTSNKSQDETELVKSLAQSPAVVGQELPVSTFSPSPNLANIYQNDLLHIKFSLKPGERVAICPENNELADSYVIQVTTSDPNLPNHLCQPGDSVPGDAININKIGVAEYFPESSEEYITQLEQDYSLSKSPVGISGVGAVRVAGSLRDIAPLPDFIDKVIFSYKGFLYDIDASYLQRNFNLIPD